MNGEDDPASAGIARAAQPPGLVLLGVNHRTCPIETREVLQKRATYPRLRKAAGSPLPWDDLVLLTTCNRIEAYAVTRDPRGALRAVRSALGIAEITEHAYVLEDEEAAAHLLRVASGLDSLAQGETQVAAQVRKAPSSRPAAWRRSRILADLFERVARESVHIRTLAGLKEPDRSASHAALAYIRFAVPIPRPAIALLGTGKMARIAAASLTGKGRVFVVNRDPRRAREVAAALGGRGYGLDHLDSVLKAADIVIAATSTKKPIVTRTRLARIRRARPDRPLWFIDLGFPRNIAAACRDVPGITLIDIDGLAPWGARPLPPTALARAESRIRREAERLVQQIRPASAADIALLRQAAEEVRRREVDEALSRLPDLDETDRAVVDKLATRLVNRFLHGPTERLRAFPEETRLEIVQELLRGMGGAAR